MSKPEAPINSIIHSIRNLVPFGKKILVACSGGADSMALLFCAMKSGYEVSVCHVVHKMRPAEDTTKDVELIHDFCAKNKIPFNEYYIENKPLEVDNEENFYRNERHRILKNCAYDNGASYILTGHNADDQLETLIMKLCRGSGLRGLSGISEIVKEVCGLYRIRPMLAITKKEIYSICAENKIPFREDYTNQNTDYRRNAIRLKVLPILRDIFPGCEKSASNTAKNIHEAQKVVIEKVRDLDKYTTEIDDNYVSGPLDVSIRVEALRLSNDIVIYEWLREAFAKASSFSRNPKSYDKFNKEMVRQVTNAIRGHLNKGFLWPNNVVVRVNQSIVRVFNNDKNRAKRCSIG